MMMDRSQSLGTRTILMNHYSTTGQKMTSSNCSKTDQMTFSNSMELTEGTEAEYNGHKGIIRFVDPSYIVINLYTDTTDPMRQVGLVVYREYWDKVTLSGEK